MSHRLALIAASFTMSAVALAGPKTSKEPAFYETPKVVVGRRLVEVAPGESLKGAFSAALVGEVIELRSGTYGARGGLALNHSGAPDGWIVVRGAPGTRPVIDLEGKGELAIGGSYVLLENVDVVNGSGNNIHIVPANASSPVSNVILRNVRSAAMRSGTGAALKIAGLWNNGMGAPTELVYVEDCELTGSIDNALVDAVGVRRSVVRGCWLHDPVVRGMKSPGIFFKGGSSDILIEKNLVSGIHGNGAIMVGGDTGAKWFDALHAKPKLEGVDEVIRNNVLADFDDAAFEIRGAKGAKIVHNTVVTQTSFAIFRLSWGGGGSGEKIGNSDIEIANNLIIATKRPQIARNDGNADATVRFGPQLWAGSFAGGEGPAVPHGPAASDIVVDPRDLASVVLDPRFERLRGLADALERFRPAPGSPALQGGTSFGAIDSDKPPSKRTGKPAR